MLKYQVVSRKNPISKSTKFYAQLGSPEPVSLDKIADMIAANCTLTRHDIVACLSAFQEQLINSLQEGKSVRLGDLGSFRVSLHSRGTDTAEEFSASCISGIKFRFYPAARLRKALKIGADGVSFSKVTVPAHSNSHIEVAHS